MISKKGVWSVCKRVWSASEGEGGPVILRGIERKTSTTPLQYTPAACTYTSFAACCFGGRGSPTKKVGGATARPLAPPVPPPLYISLHPYNITPVTLTAHACQGLIIYYFIERNFSTIQSKQNILHFRTHTNTQYYNIRKST